MWQRVALVMGWNKWDLNVEDAQIQEARDKASFAFQAGEKDKDRKINVLLQSMAQEANATLVDNSVTNKLKEALGIFAVDKILN